MSNTAILSVMCDTDPDNHLPCHVGDKGNAGHIWRGITSGIVSFRQRLKNTSFLSKYKRFPVTWLLRSDRQIYEFYGNAAFCFQEFERIWKNELDQGNEIGWHPHLYQWNKDRGRWIPYLDRDDDIEILNECLNSLRQYVDIYTVRTGWDYHSNRLMNFFDAQGLLVDASAIPGCTHGGDWSYDWKGTIRKPYLPSKHDYRMRSMLPESSLNILEMPVLVRRLNIPLHIVRYGIRNLRNMKAISRSFNDYWADWESSRWQGALITGECSLFYEAVKQTLSACSGNEDVFLTTYFHTGDLLSPRLQERFIRNLENVSHLAERFGYTVLPTTLSTAASLAKG